MAPKRIARWWTEPWMAALLTSVAVALLSIHPAWLVPFAEAYEDICARSEILARLTHRMPPLSLALLLNLGLLSWLLGVTALALGFFRTLRLDHELRRQAHPLPPRLARVAADLGLTNRLTFLTSSGLAAFCYGLASPHIAVTAGLIDRLDDEELIAVLTHERHHMRRRDPLRYLAMHTLGVAICMLPLTSTVRRRLEVRLELAADRAALAVVSPGALAGALLVMLRGGESWGLGAVAALSATEARIAHLAGRTISSPLPPRAVFASLGFLGLVSLAALQLATVSGLVPMACALCSHLS
jgi:Zn-dependent protease with chaperone function